MILTEGLPALWKMGKILLTYRMRAVCQLALYGQPGDDFEAPVERELSVRRGEALAAIAACYRHAIETKAGAGAFKSSQAEADYLVEVGRSLGGATRDSE